MAEAKKRGLSNIKDTPRALEVYIHKESIELFKRMNVFNEREMHARHEIRLEGYTKKIQIESRVMGDLVLNHILPVALKYQSEIVNNIKGLKEVLSPSDFNKMSVIQLDMVKKIAVHIEVIKKSVDQMTEERKKANKLSSQKEMALAYRDKVFPFFETIRYHVDKLELIVDDAYWPLPKFRELLFTN